MEEESRALFLAAARHSSPFPIDISTVEIQLERLLIRRQRVGGNGYHRAFHRALALVYAAEDWGGKLYLYVVAIKLQAS